MIGQSNTFVINKLEDDVILNEYLEVIELDKESPTLSDLQGNDWQDRFVTYDNLIQNYLPAVSNNRVLLDPNKVYWWRLTILNNLDQPIHNWVLHTGRSNFTEVYFIGEDGQLADTKHTGWLMPTDQKDYLMGNRQAERVSFNLPEGGSVTLYGKVSVINKKEPFIHVQLSREDYYKNWGFIEKTRLEWMAIGSLLTFILINLLLYTSTRDRVFFWHSLYLLGIFLYLLEYFNVLPDLIWARDHRNASQVFIYATLCLMDVACLQFIRTFMNMKKSRPFWDKRFGWFILARIVYAIGIIIFFLATVNMKTADDLTAIYMVVQYVGLLGLLIWLFGWKNKQGRFLIAGTAVFVAAIVINAFAVIIGVGLIFSFTQFGVMGEVILFTLGLGYRMKRLTRKKREAERLKDLDDFKTRFYTNITHEFRTPLTVIMGNSELGKMEIEKIEDAQSKKPSPHFQFLNSQFDTISNNAGKLLRLINRLLDLAKLQSRKMPLLMVQGDIAGYLRYLVESFHSHAAGKDIQLRFLSELDEFYMDFDVEKIQDIMSNLLSNAIKFSPPGGEIIILVKQNLPIETMDEQLLISVKDNGPGIPQEALPFIFERFSTAKDTGNPAGGSGIGLALTKELVDLMRGQITVKSELDQGSNFTISLPVTREALKSGKITSEFSAPEMQSAKLSSLPLPTPTHSQEDKPVCLVIDDNADIVRFLQNLLINEYEVLSAFNGKAGIEKAIDQLPDVIISDVMMPEKDGLEVCDTLKNDERTSHIPIILLTAKATIEDRIEGLRRGADAYLQKPFNREELFVCLKKSIELRNHLISYFSKLPPGFRPNEREVPELVIENAFIQKARAAVEENLSDDKFNIHSLCRMLTLSRAQLHRKLTALTGKSASHFIRSIRLAKGKDLLITTKLTIAEVAYEVGFRDPHYFSRTFSEEFGVSPSETRK